MSDIDGGSGGIAILDQPSAPAPEPEEKDNRRKLLIWLAIVGALLLLVVAVLAWYLMNRKPLNELPILGNEAMPTYQYSIYGVDKPLGVAVSPDGDKVYVTQSAGKRTVLEFDHSGKLLNTFETPKNVNVGLPAYVAVNPTDGSVYVSDQLAKAVLAFDADGHFQRIVKPVGLTGTWSPLGLAFDHSGDLYVTEVGGKTHRVVVLDQFGKVLRTMAPVDVALSFPNGIAVDASGNVFVADSNNGRLIAFDADGKAIGGANRGIGEGDLGLPRGVAVDSNGRVYVVDTTNQTIHGYKLTSDGANRISFVGAFGDEGIADGLFEYPNGIATDSRSNVYVTDRENGRVQVWN